MKGGEGSKKKRNCTETAQPPTLAAFLPWGNSAGAGRTALRWQK